MPPKKVSPLLSLSLATFSLLLLSRTGHAEEAPSLMHPSLSLNASNAKKAPSVLAPIDRQLRAFRAHDIRKAYEEFSSDEFKRNTSFEELVNYVKLYPALMDHDQVLIRTQAERGDRAEVIIVLDQDHLNLPVQYELVKENNEWRVWSMEVVSGYSSDVRELLKSPSSLEAPVRDFFSLLHKNNILEAYYKKTSHEFQSTVSIEAFRKFFVAHSELVDYGAINIQNGIIHNGTGQVEVVIDGKNIRSRVELTFGIVENQWKIWGINILKQEPMQQQKEPFAFKEEFLGSKQVEHEVEVAGSLQFVKIALGGRVDDKGRIMDPQINFGFPHETMHVELYILNGTEGDKIDVRLKHEASQSGLPLISTTLQKSGDSILSFAFSPPASGWPEGRYQLTALSSQGIKRTFIFLVNGAGGANGAPLE